MPYTQQGAAVQTGGFGQIAPSVVNPNDAFDLLQKAFKTGLLQASEINNALNVIPAQQQGEIAKAGDAVGQAESNARMRPILERQKTAEGELHNRELQSKIDDPLGLGKTSAAKLATLGGTVTGDWRKDSAEASRLEKLAKAKEDFDDDKRRLLNQLAAEAFKYNEDPKLDWDEPVDTAISRINNLVEKAKAKHTTATDTAKRLAEARAKLLNEHNVTSDKIPATLTEAEDMLATLGGVVAAEKKVSGVHKTEGQRKASIYVAEVDAVNQTIDKLESEGFLPSVKGQGLQRVASWDIPVVSAGANALTSTPEQGWTQAKKKWIEAVLRDRSGAAIANAEYDKADRQYFTQPGDAPETQKQKQYLRRVARDAIAETAGNGTGAFFTADGTIGHSDSVFFKPVAEGSPAASPTTPAVPSAGVQVRRNPATGELFYFRPVPGDPTKGIRTDPAGNPL